MAVTRVPETFPPSMTVAELERTARFLGYVRLTLVVDRDGPHWHGVKAAAPSTKESPACPETLEWPFRA